MADKKKGGRYTPKAGATPPKPESAAEKAKRDRIDPDEIVQVGKRPSSPGFLFGIAAMWMGAGIFIWMYFSASWKLIPAVFAAGIGLFFLRGALQTIIRHEERVGDAEDN